MTVIVHQTGLSAIARQVSAGKVGAILPKLAALGFKFRPGKTASCIDAARKKAKRKGAVELAWLTAYLQDILCEVRP